MSLKLSENKDVYFIVDEKDVRKDIAMTVEKATPTLIETEKTIQDLLPDWSFIHLFDVDSWGVLRLQKGNTPDKEWWKNR